MEEYYNNIPGYGNFTSLNDISVDYDTLKYELTTRNRNNFIPFESDNTIDNIQLNMDYTDATWKDVVNYLTKNISNQITEILNDILPKYKKAITENEKFDECNNAWKLYGERTDKLREELSEKLNPNTTRLTNTFPIYHYQYIPPKSIDNNQTPIIFELSEYKDYTTYKLRQVGKIKSFNFNKSSNPKMNSIFTNVFIHNQNSTPFVGIDGKVTLLLTDEFKKYDLKRQIIEYINRSCRELIRNGKTRMPVCKDPSPSPSSSYTGTTGFGNNSHGGSKRRRKSSRKSRKSRKHRRTRRR